MTKKNVRGETDGKILQQRFLNKIQLEPNLLPTNQYCLAVARVSQTKEETKHRGTRLHGFDFLAWLFESALALVVDLFGEKNSITTEREVERARGALWFKSFPYKHRDNLYVEMTWVDFWIILSVYALLELQTREQTLNLVLFKVLSVRSY